MKITHIAALLVIFIFSAVGQTLPQSFPGSHKVELERHRNTFKKISPDAIAEFRSSLTLKSIPTKEVFGYLPFWVYDNYENLNYELLSTIAYFGAEINEFGVIVNSYHWPASQLISRAHAEGVRVVLTAILFNPLQLQSLLSDPNRRTNLVLNLLSEVHRANADGVTIDFEGVPSGQKENLVAFMAELTETFHAALPGSFVTIFTPAVDWQEVFDYAALADITDGLIMQGYDYHWSTGATAGPVSPLNGTRWGFYNVTWTVNDYLNKTGFNKDKLILGVPFYGYEWPTEDDALESNALDVAKAFFYEDLYSISALHGKLWDDESHTPWYKFDNAGWHQGWFDDSLSLAKKFELVEELDLRGVSIWALTYDGVRPELQGALREAFGQGVPTNVGSDDGEPLPFEFSLRRNYPNPFNPETVIAFQLTGRNAVTVRLEIFNVAGERVAVLLEGELSPGLQKITWHGTDSNGMSMPSGVYLYRLTVGQRAETRKMLLVR